MTRRSRFTTDPAKAPTVWHYTPFLLSVLAVALSAVVVGVNVWAWWSM